MTHPELDDEDEFNPTLVIQFADLATKFYLSGRYDEKHPHYRDRMREAASDTAEMLEICALEIAKRGKDHQ